MIINDIYIFFSVIPEALNDINFFISVIPEAQDRVTTQASPHSFTSEQKATIKTIPRILNHYVESFDFQSEIIRSDANPCGNKLCHQRIIGEALTQ